MVTLITGAAGYIGSHVTDLLVSNGETVVAIDSLVNGFPQALAHLDKEKFTFLQGDVRDSSLVEQIINEYKVDSIIHFAAYIEVGESVTDPLKYYENNIMGAISLLQAMRNSSCKHIVFSSTAALFGVPESTPIPDDAPTKPINPYGESKLFVEHILKASAHAYGIKFVSLRYFNACGAHPSGDIGEAHNPESHLIPIILQVALGKRQSIKIFGTDYPTRDGTCVRDYVHVVDLADAHYKALLHLRKGNESGCFNLGSGNGFSVREVIEVAREVTGHAIPAIEDVRRPGDPAVLIADSRGAETVLGWKKQFSDIKTVIESAWKWHSKHPNGYESPVIE
ncbi:hypothetical protein RCL1_000023 [Eukaryota sp. TZLM3-RCL]